MQGKCTESGSLKSTQASCLAHGDAALQAVSVNLPSVSTLLKVHFLSDLRVPKRPKDNIIKSGQQQGLSQKTRPLTPTCKGIFLVTKLQFAAFTPTDLPFYGAARNPLSPHSKLQM